VVIIVVKREQFCVVDTVVKKGQFWVVIELLVLSGYHGG